MVIESDSGSLATTLEREIEKETNKTNDSNMKINNNTN